MKTYNLSYRKFIDDKNTIVPEKMKRNNFYLIRDYVYVDGVRGKYSETDAPIIYTLFVSKIKDVVHCVKVSNIRPDLVKKFFAKFLNKNTNELEMKGRSSAIYEQIVKKVPIVTDDAYRTYKLSGLKRVLFLDMDIDKITPKRPAVAVKQAIPEKPEIKPKPKIKAKEEINSKEKPIKSIERKNKLRKK
jgi:hypothetical protein